MTDDITWRSLPIDGQARIVPPPFVLTFTQDGQPVGRLTIVENALRFEGNADESAKVFFNDFLKPLVDAHLQRH